MPGSKLDLPWKEMLTIARRDLSICGTSTEKRKFDESAQCSWSNLLSQDEKDVQDSCERSLVETDVENESSFIDQAPPPRKKRKSELFDRALEKVCEINEMDRIGYFMEFAAATVRKFSYEKQNKALDAFYNILSEMNKEM
ncbi:hypothetical protein CDAR_204991 [Caerostris darwini]|uniref:Uncharacterized protein n=1 Tax=Caerostris darwini TaxID=1538125 RepID=A0AAV4SRZ8_9ARAC|nr:hypothetical protein CDAR_204991 [Caerostris darwini]